MRSPQVSPTSQTWAASNLSIPVDRIWEVNTASAGSGSCKGCFALSLDYFHSQVPSFQYITWRVWQDTSTFCEYVLLVFSYKEGYIDLNINYTRFSSHCKLCAYRILLYEVLMRIPHEHCNQFLTFPTPCVFAVVWIKSIARIIY